MTDTTDIADLAGKLAEAEKLFTLRRAECDAARRAESAALNELNNAQKEFDAAVAALRDAAPSGSDWTRKKDYLNAE